MRHILLILLWCSCLSLAGCHSVPQYRLHQDKVAIEQVVKTFAQAIVEKNKPLYMNLFFSDRADEIGWQFVSEDSRLVHIRKTKPDAIKARRIPSNNFISLIDATVAAKEPTEEKFSNVQIDTDGEIASVSFDYEFYEAGKRTNWGKEMWQLVRTENGWKIFSVIYTIRDQLSASGA
jgi:hypothetical protein